MSTALNTFLQQTVQHGGIPFELKLNNPNEGTLTAMHDADSGENLSRMFDSVEELFEDLDV
jgi:DNA-damage-inducible protein J